MSKRALLIISLAVLALAAGLFLVLRNQHQAPPQPTTSLPEQSIHWSAKSMQVLQQYLAASSNEERLHACTPTKETRYLLKSFPLRAGADDLVNASEFVAKSLPPSFEQNGIYLLYYQRPDTLPNDVLFRPIVPMRVNLALDSPSFLDESARSGYVRPKKRQNICAFFKRHADGRLTLDWPIFVQTRYRLVRRHFTHKDAQQKTVLRLMVRPMHSAVSRHHFTKKFPHHDWYNAFCPGYDNEFYPIAVPKTSPAAEKLRDRFQKHPTNVHAITAEIQWQKHNQSRISIISKLHSFEFFGLNHQTP